MKTAHTPAPWKIEHGQSPRVYLINDSRNDALGEIVYSDTRNPADARLIAAAPELLAMLQRFVNAESRMGGNNAIAGIADEARAIIEKVTA